VASSLDPHPAMPTARTVAAAAPKTLRNRMPNSPR
jgi:hypothetical protein